jgi:beta-glucosidase
MGKEFFDKGANVQLGPGMCITRVPRNGRNFEYISGEDPVLGAELVGPVIEGIQSQGVIANAKHWVQNNQETDRGDVDENVDERTQFELYYQPFEAAAAAGVGSVMCSCACSPPRPQCQKVREKALAAWRRLTDWNPEMLSRPAAA